MAYEIKIEDGKFAYKSTEQLLDTTEGPADVKWIFVLSTTKTLYVGQKSKGKFQHSSFLAGGATLSAGRLLVENGLLKVYKHFYDQFKRQCFTVLCNFYLLVSVAS